jgi:hypothetical protein
LVALLQERPAPGRNGQSVWVIYRVSDAALFLAAVAMHHLRVEGDFDKLLGASAWPEALASLAPRQALVTGRLIVLAAAGKSALVPFSCWLPPAMEGPTVKIPYATPNRAGRLDPPMAPLASWSTRAANGEDGRRAPVSAGHSRGPRW